MKERKFKNDYFIVSSTYIKHLKTKTQNIIGI